jgi:site-specific DNA recombinase
MYDVLKPIDIPASGKLRVLGIARISTKNQDGKSLDDQQDMHREFVRDNYDGPFDYDVVATQAKGELLDREELDQIRAAINGQEFNLIIMEDLGRLLRGLEAVNFCKMAVDQEVRLIAINDGVDTASDDWEDKAGTASLRHARYCEETSRRIKQRKRARFMREGRALACEIFGYIKKLGAQTEMDLVRDPAAEPIYDRMFTALENGSSYAEVADGLNDDHVAVGPFCRTKCWTGPMVANLVHNPILKGVRVRNRMVSRKHHATGKRRSVKAKPEELRTRNCPHLAFIAPERYDRVLHVIDSRNKHFGRKPVNGHDPFLNRPRKRTTWPGQHMYCSVCNRMFIYDGHGRTGFLTCAGTQSHNCWNTFSVEGAEAGRRIYAAVLEAIQNLPRFDEAFQQMVEAKLQEAGTGREDRLRDLERQRAANEREGQHLLAHIREFGSNSLVNDEIRRMEQVKANLTAQMHQIQTAAAAPQQMPPIETLRSMARDAIGELAPDSPEFLRQMQQLIPQIWLYPVRLLDGGHVVQRARFTLNLSPLIKGVGECSEVATKLSRTVTVNLHDVPDREKHRPAVVAAMLRLGNQHEVAAELGIAQAVVSKALQLQHRMDDLGVSDPYALVTAPPQDYGKLRLHRHKRYNFLPDVNRPAAPPYVS